MTKRVVTKIGNVFETTDKRHLLHLVAIDSVQLNSDVVAVYNATENIELENLHNKPMLFYHHTTVSEGVREGFWRKIGNAPLPDISKLLFKTYFTPDDISVIHLTPDDNDLIPEEDRRRPINRPHWAVWTPVDHDRRFISDQKGLELKAEDGGVVPASWLKERIDDGGIARIPPYYPGQSMQPRLNDVAWLNKGFGTSDEDAIEHVDGEWFATGDFSLYDSYDRVYNATKPFYRKIRGNKDGNLGYRFEFIACSEGFPKVAGRYFAMPVPKTFLVVKQANTAAIKERLRLRVGHAYFKTLVELRDFFEEFADVSELDYAIKNYT